MELVACVRYRLRVRIQLNVTGTGSEIGQTLACDCAGSSVADPHLHTAALACDPAFHYRISIKFH